MSKRRLNRRARPDVGRGLRTACLVAACLVAIGVLLLIGVRPAGAGAQVDEPPLLISEVLVNAGQGAEEAAFEWVELWNRSAQALSLEGWALEDNTAQDPLPAAAVPPGGFVLVVGGADRAASFAEQALAEVVIAMIDDGRIGNGLANSGDRLLLRDPSGTVVDALSWGDDRSITNLPAPIVVRTLSRDAETGRFHHSDPTPGALAAAPAPPEDAPPPLRITEIFANAGRGQEDARYEWVELFNPTDAPVELAGWRVADNGASDLLTGGSIPAGGYLVIAASADAIGKAVNAVIVTDGCIGNGLANAGDAVSLIDPFDRLVDAVDYAGPPLPLPEPGHSIARQGEGWVLNTAPSPGAAEVEPLFAALGPDGAAAEGGRASVREEGDGGGVPGLAFVAIALGIPALAFAARLLWRARPRGAERRSVPDLLPPNGPAPAPPDAGGPAPIIAPMSEGETAVPERLQVIAIDGPVASGKTVVGRAIAQRLGWAMLDTGVMYRALTWVALQRGTPLDDPKALTDLARSVEFRVAPPSPGSPETATVFVDNLDSTPHLRERAVEANVSPVAAVPGVRERMVELQRGIAPARAGW